MAKLDCVSERDLKAFLLGDLPKRLADTIARHLEQCADCEQRARTWDNVADPVIAALRQAQDTSAPPNPEAVPADKGSTLPATSAAATEIRSPEGYTLLEELGRGASGVVYKARQHHPERLVALKFLLGGSHADTGLRARFLAEADAIARLDHPQIVRVHAAQGQHGQLFLCLEYVDGGTLQTKTGGLPQAPREAAHLTQLLARAVQHAHDQGVIHRDLKPGNVLLTRAGSPKIADFGLAHFSRPELTATGAILGTPAYMAPEQAQGAAAVIGPPADVWALGVILYELLTGRPPFRGVQALDTLQLVVEREPVAPASLQPGIPRDLNVICLKCLEKNVARRYPSAAALADDLQRFMNGEPIQARAVGPVSRAWRWCRRKPALALATFLAGVGLLASIVVSVWFALYQWQANTDLETANHGLDSANTKLTQKQQEITAALLEARLLSCQLAKENGLALCRAGDVHAGLLWLTEALRLAPPESEDLQTLLRAQLAQWQQKAAPLRLVLRHPGAVRAAAFGVDGKTLYTGCGDGKVRRWDAQTGLLLDEPVTLGGYVARILESFDGKMLWADGDKGGQMFDRVSGKAVHQKRVDLPVLTAIRTCLGGNGGNTLLRVLRQPPSPFGDAEITTIAASGEKKTIHIKKVRASLLQAVSPDGRFILLDASPGGFAVRSAQTGAMVGPPLPAREEFTSSVFSPDGSLLLFTDTHSNVRVWHVNSGKWIGSALRHPAGVEAAAFSPDGKWIVTGCTDGGARLWQWQRPAKTGQDLKLKEKALWQAFSQDGHRAFVSQEPGLSLLDTETGKIRLTLPYQAGLYVFGLAMTADGRVLATALHSSKGGDPGKVLLWNAATGQRIGPTLVHPFWVRGLAFSPDGKLLATGGADRKVRLWNVATGTLTGKVLEHLAPVRTVAFAPEGTTLLAAGERVARLWDLASGQVLGTYRYPGAISALAVAKGGKIILLGGKDRTARLWDVTTGKPVGPPLTHPQPVGAVAFSADGHFAVTGSQSKVLVWEASTGQALGPDNAFPPAPDYVRALAFSPNGQKLCVGTTTALHCWPTNYRLPGTAQQLIQSTQLLTGMELNSNKELQALDVEGWNKIRLQLAH
jgi:serine/threonine protein kinase/WD40 repeat protein